MVTWPNELGWTVSWGVYGKQSIAGPGGELWGRPRGGGTIDGKQVVMMDDH